MQNKGSGQNAVIESNKNLHLTRWWSLFRMQGQFLVNERGKVLDIHGGRDEEQRQLIFYGKHGKLNQQWDIIYADEWPEEPKKGELNKDYGLYVKRPFYVVSQLPNHRYLDNLNNANQFVIKSHFGIRKSQLFWFDQKTLTIKSMVNNKSWDIVSSGSQNKIQLYNTNSKWWQCFKYKD